MQHPESEVRFGVLGPLLAGDAAAAREIPAARQRIMLAAMLLRANHTVPAGELAEQVWNGEPPTGAATTLRSYVMRLRRALGPAVGPRLRTRAPGYLVEVRDDGELDLLLFNALRRRGQDAAARLDWPGAAADLRAALGLWRGDALEDVPAGYLRDREVPSLQESRIQAEELLARAELELGRPGEALERVLRLQAEHPFREQLSCLLMRAQVAAGRSAEALEEFTRLRRVLVDELGVEPGRHSRALQAAILAERPLPPWPVQGRSPGSPTGAGRPVPGAGGSPAVPAQLPGALRDFTGRAHQVEYVCDALTAAPLPDRGGGAAALCLVSGAGGVGKTTLAVQVAHQLAARFPDGQLFVNLHGSADHPVAPGEALARFLRAFGVPDSGIPRDEQEREVLYRSHLATRRVLVVLDDARDTAQIRSLLPGSATCAVLVTSRSRCASLSASARSELGAMTREEADSLFTTVVGADRAQAEPGARSRILDACDEHPLAVRIAAARLVARPDWSLEHLADRLAEQRRRLGELVVEDLGVRASFGLSYETLLRSSAAEDREAARVFRMLGLWEGRDIRPAAVAALTGRSAADTERSLERLVDIHFLAEPRAGWFAVHDLLHLFARELAAEAGTGARPAVERLGGWYLHSTYQAMEHVKPERNRFDLAEAASPATPQCFDSYPAALEWLDAERPNLLAVVRQAASLRTEALARLLPMELLHHLLLRRDIAAVIETQSISLDSARRCGDAAHEAVSLNCLAHAYMELRRIDEALASAHAALEIQTGLGDVHGQAAATESIAMSHYFADRHAEALLWYERALPLRRQAANLFGLVATLNNLGLVYLELGRAEDAAATFRELVPTSREAGSVVSEATALLNLGEACTRLGRHAEAEEALRAGIGIARGSDNTYVLATGLRMLGDTLAAGGHQGGGTEAWREAAALFEQLDDPTAAELRRLIAEAEAPAGAAAGQQAPGVTPPVR